MRESWSGAVISVVSCKGSMKSSVYQGACSVAVVPSLVCVAFPQGREASAEVVLLCRVLEYSLCCWACWNPCKMCVFGSEGLLLS